jgi:hypothetical protein
VGGGLVAGQEVAGVLIASSCGGRLAGLAFGVALAVLLGCSMGFIFAP